MTTKTQMSVPKSRRVFGGETDSDEAPMTIPLIKKIPLKRSRSYPYLGEVYPEKISFWIYYCIVVGIFAVVLVMFPFARFYLPVLTVLNVFHAIITFVLMHYNLGKSFETFNGGYECVYTFWEQLPGLPNEYTKVKKAFMIIPILLCLAACYECDWKKRYYFANLVALGFCLIPKMPVLHGKRIFGWNARA